jgi:F-type H+-transporting ATPase subunit gamma
MVPTLLPLLPGQRDLGPDDSQLSSQVAVLVIGSERGLCGRFNTAVVECAAIYLAEQAEAGSRVALFALGSRLGRQLEQRKQPLARSQSLPAATSALAQLAFDLTRGWLAGYEAYSLDELIVIHNAYQGVGRYEAITTRLIPPALPPQSEAALNGVSLIGSWPPPIIETDPLRLYTRIIEQWTAISLYQRLLESAMAEQSARFQLMEASTQNAERLIDELTMTMQTARRQAITQEIQTLVAGAGLVGTTN